MSVERRQIEFTPAAEPNVALGVFDTMLVVDGIPLEAPRHLARLATSLHELYGQSLPVSLNERLMSAADGHELARLRVDVAPGDLEGAIRIEPFERALVLAEQDRELATVNVAGGFGAHKLVDRAWLDQIEAAAGEGVRALMVAPSGALLETTRANVFLLRGGVIATPPLDGSILPGVTRAVLLERAGRAEISSHELPLTLADLGNAEAVLLTSSLRLLECARVRDGRRSADVLARLRAALAP
ncbi:MAG TPA: aminotransferase class IV [Solirubrobacteraceae bacterium]|nr:aminotransferase class IV [Solirubrobacteraceae bacterium]